MYIVKEHGVQSWLEQAEIELAVEDRILIELEEIRAEIAQITQNAWEHVPQVK